MNFDADYGRQYEAIVTGTIPGYEHLFLMARGLLEAALPERANLLIVGAGGGKELVTFGRVPGWQFVGVDPSAQMIEFARFKAAQAGIDERVRLHQGLTADLPAEPSFDAAACILVLHFIPGDAGKLALLRDIAARLKPGASLVLASIYGEGFGEDFIGAWRVFQRERGRTPDEIDAQEARARETTDFITEPRLLALLDAAGFEQVQRFYTAFWFGGWTARKK